MADRTLPTGAPVAGQDWIDSIDQNIDTLYNNVSLIPTVITNSGNDYTLTVDPVLNADVIAGMRFVITPNVSNTGIARIRITSGNPYYDLTFADGSVLAAGDFDSGTIYDVIFASGSFRIVSAESPVADSGVKHNTQSFLTSGTWTKPAGLDDGAWVRVQMWGGGGSGTRSPSANTSRGGGGASYNEHVFLASDLGASETVTIGAGAAGQPTDLAPGLDGGDTSFGSLLVAGGGFGGIYNAAAGVGGFPFAGASSTSNGETNATLYRGGVGGVAATIQNILYGGAGGSTGGGLMSSFHGGNGGSVNAAGTVPGGGGGGGVNAASGAGASGQVIVTVLG